MSIDAFFQQWEAEGYRFPSSGQAIEWRRRSTTDWVPATVDFCWAGCEPTVKLVGGMNIFPTLGDDWRPA